MHTPFTYLKLTLSCVLIAWCSSSYAQEREPKPSALRDDIPTELRELQKRGLRLEGPRVRYLGKFNFPPKLKGFPTESSVQLDIKPSGRASVAEARTKFREVAVNIPRMKDLLGERFALLSSGWIELEKDREESGDADRYELMFYSYARNQVVTAVTNRSGELIDVSARTVKVQPPESREEIDAAAAIVRAQSRHDKATAGLIVRGIQTEGEGDHRTLYLTFYKENSRRAVYEATVDMTAGKVVFARPVRVSK